MSQVLFVLACLVLPVIWGVVVHRVFDIIERHRYPEGSPRESNFPDYQI